jgi:hypothetical protein
VTQSRVLALLVVVLSAVVGLPAVPADSAPAVAKRASWTVLEYVNADVDNIEKSMLDFAVRTLPSVDLGDTVNVIALVDRTPGQDDGPLLNLPNFVDAKLVKAEHGQFTVLQDLNEVDMGDGQTLAWFVANGMQQFPADHYALFIMDHGGGLDGASWDASSPLPNGDYSHLELNDITDALHSALQATGVARFDLVGYAACLMATYDAAAKLAPLADFMLASEEISVTPNFDQTGMLRLLKNNPQATGLDLAKTVVDLTDHLSLDYPERTMSVIDLHAISRVGQALDAFANAVDGDIVHGAPALAKAQANALQFGTEGGSTDHYHLYDLNDLLANFAEVSPAITTARNALYEAVKRSVVAETHGEVSSSATGLSIYFPVTTAGALDRLGADEFAIYSRVAASEAWSKMLGDYRQTAVSTNATAPAFSSPDITLQVGPSGVLATASLVAGTEGSVTKADFFGGLVLQDGSIEYAYIAPAVLGAGGPQVVAQAWNLGGVQLADGTTFVDATMRLSTTGDKLVGSIPISYQTAAGVVTPGTLKFVLGPDGSVQGAPRLFVFDLDGSASNVDPAPGSRIIPFVLIVPPGGKAEFQVASPQGVDGPTLQVTTAHLPSGSTFAVALVALDIASNGAIATGTGVVP